MKRGGERGRGKSTRKKVKENSVWYFHNSSRTCIIKQVMIQVANNIASSYLEIIKK